MSLFESLGVSLPIVQAPMVGVSTPELAAAVCNAGALGSIGVAATDARGAAGYREGGGVAGGDGTFIPPIWRATATRTATHLQEFPGRRRDAGAAGGNGPCSGQLPFRLARCRTDCRAQECRLYLVRHGD